MGRFGMIWVSLLAAVLGIAQARTCADDDAFGSFVVEVQSFTLRDKVGHVVGTASVETGARKKENGVPSMTNCFRLKYSVDGDYTILKLRAGIYIQGVAIPDGAGRYTKRKKVSDGNVLITEERMDICPSRVTAVDDPSCCESVFELLGGALIQGIEPGSKPKQVWLSASSNCREIDEIKPFQLACTMEIECTDCPQGACRIGSECYLTADAKSKLSCGLTEEAAVTDSGECGCRQCSPLQCFNGDRCVEDADFDAFCPFGQTISSDNVLCQCEPLCTDDSCFIGSECFTLKQTGVTAIPEFDALGCNVDEGVAASDEGECVCEPCASNQCSSGAQCFDRVEFSDTYCERAEVVEPDNPVCTCTCFPEPDQITTCTDGADGECYPLKKVFCDNSENPIFDTPIVIDGVCSCPPGTRLSLPG
mmetsp:Transcript_9499/g.13854  ORF Transcript_9499/g.13854 Transcript_9499/m.13854 type:complete len:421 (-) Transcript_9499:128-1390(-)|eukprot:CAMPEP_0184743854 /NCGR_PEP_ID=MMETSP0315-20130426/6641_1 /TAXON_ID=101924 /ORGANISM="Rhodosorus marinus, Strain UTEX LB 2760" /LENGTH=420 /DNA_ID=CAMNT_0027215283 /DNA_START=214 /DNA_END=1479 /DNA_ORIENTATION=+